MARIVSHVSRETVGRPDGDAAFGRDVLDALVAPLREAAASPTSERNWGPGVLGCAMWMDDPELIDALGRMANACVVITKQQSHKYNQESFGRLETLAQTNGLALAAYPELEDLAPRVDGRARGVDPSRMAGQGAAIGAVRELGFRRVGSRLVPIVHAKMLLLGRMGWTDEHPSGHLSDVLFFAPERLWIGSANFTASSRESLEMGMWTTDAELMSAARDWILRLIAMSEPLRSASDDSDPELVPVELDEAAIAEYMGGLAGNFDSEQDDADDGDI
jgi:hypothetical protein